MFPSALLKYQEFLRKVGYTRGVISIPCVPRDHVVYCRINCSEASMLVLFEETILSTNTSLLQYSLLLTALVLAGRGTFGSRSKRTDRTQGGPYVQTSR